MLLLSSDSKAIALAGAVDTTVKRFSFAPENSVDELQAAYQNRRCVLYSWVYSSLTRPKSGVAYGRETLLQALSWFLEGEKSDLFYTLFGYQVIQFGKQDRSDRHLRVAGKSYLVTLVLDSHLGSLGKLDDFLAERVEEERCVLLISI